MKPVDSKIRNNKQIYLNHTNRCEELELGGIKASRNESYMKQWKLVDRKIRVLGVKRFGEIT